MRGIHEAPGMSNCLGNPESFFPKASALGEPAELGMARGEIGIDEHGGQESLAKRSWRRAPSKNTTVCPRQSIA